MSSLYVASIDKSDQAIILSPVQYINYEKEHVDRNHLTPFFRKRKSFAAEAELRACFTSLDGREPIKAASENPAGIKVGCDVRELVHRVFVSPSSPSWYRDIVEGLSGRLGYCFDVHQSPLGSPAIL